MKEMATVPYAASTRWYAAWSRAMTEGADDDEAAAYANSLTIFSGKDFARCRIAGSRETILLSVPVEGGSARLRRLSAVATSVISNHGNWRHVHLGALNAAYGRCPYFIHYFPLLEPVYSAPVVTLAEFTLCMHEALADIILGKDAMNKILFSFGSGCEVERGMEIYSGLDPELSVIDALMRHGPETILGLLASPEPS